MFNVCSAFRVAQYIGRKKLNNMTLFSGLFFLLFCVSRYLPVRDICADFGVTVSVPGLVAYALNDRWTLFIFVLCWFYQVGDAPFYDQTIQYVLFRCRRTEWAAGVALYILFSAGCFILLAAVSCVASVFPHINFRMEWDSVLRSLASVYSLRLKYRYIFSFSPYIYMNYSVGQAVFWGLSLQGLLLVFYGMLVGLLNTVSKRKIGVLVAGLIAVMDISAMIWIASDLYYFYSPVSLTTLSVLDLHGVSHRPTPYYSIGFFALSIVLALGLFLYATDRRSIVEIKKADS